MGNSTSLTISPTSSFSSSHSFSSSSSSSLKSRLKSLSRPKSKKKQQPIIVSYPQPVYSSVTDEKLKRLHPKNIDDVQEMQVSHHICQFLWQSHFSAPVEERLMSGARVLDVGCNPGAWLFEIASAYPLTDFIGIDINPLFPNSSDINQHNIKFVQADVLGKLPFEDDSFDYIRMSSFANIFMHDEWQPALQELVRVLKPGGFLELMEPDYRLQNMGPDTAHFNSSLLQYLSLQHVNAEIVRKLELLLAATNGLGDIDHSFRSVPISRLGGSAGGLLEDTFIIYCREVFSDLAEFMELSLGEYEELLQSVKKEFVTFETFCKIYRFWAVKNR